MDSTTVQAPFKVVTDGWKNLPSMNIPNTEGFIKDVYENPEGSVMCAGFFELNHADEPLEYVYEYDEMKVILEGELVMENKDTGQSVVVKARDAIFIPKGSRIQFTTQSSALAFYAGHRDANLL